MCIVCNQWKVGKLTNKEALDALGKMIKSTKDDKKSKHYFKVVEKILDKEVPMSDTNDELDKKWHEETHTEE